ncbi:hypothetical protein AB0O01_02935 [Streptomyces sp. NPDC093252]|uniref:hypothetical protein n=1 Tax=Streptomyces sp. NPDC093252 TaxID=3154980 RepID=UPI0034146A11
MLTDHVDEDVRNTFWPRVREFAVPPSMIETATARRLAGDWAGACAAARVDADLSVRFLARSHGRDLAARLRDDLRHLAPDLLRWHLPRIAPDGVLRPGLTVALARYAPTPLYLVARTVPAWADSGQRITLTVWDSSGTGGTPGPHRLHPHPRPHPRFRLDLHRHLWDARRAGELAARSAPGVLGDGYAEVLRGVPGAHRLAVGRWGDEARLLLRALGRRDDEAVLVRAGGGHRFLVDTGGRVDPVGAVRGGVHVPMLPDAAVWVPPDVELLRTGAIDAGRLHPLVAAALAPGPPPSTGAPPTDPTGLSGPTGPTGLPRMPGPTSMPGMSGPTGMPGRDAGPRRVECRGAAHRIGLVDGVLVPFDHDPDEIRREELLAALTGTPLPCLQVIDRAHRDPECLPDVRERLRHGDLDGALTVVEDLLGPAASMRDGALREALESAARQRITYGLFRAGLGGPREPGPPGRDAGPREASRPPGPPRRPARDERRSRPRLAQLP